MVPEWLKLCFCLVLLATVIHGDFAKLERRLKKMARSGDTIYDLFVPSNKGLIIRTEISLLFKGTKIDGGQSVALKFTPKIDRFIADREFHMYGYLDAINNPIVENYGIPNIHYYQEYEEYMLTVLSLFDGGDLEDLYSKEYFDHRDANLAINSFILFRDFVIQSKYIHSRGVRHDDIKPPNTAVRGRRSFLIDFNSASKMTEDNLAGTMMFYPRKYHNGEVRTPKSDWESFFYTMAFINDIELGWFFSNPYIDQARNEVHLYDMVGEFMKNKTEYLMTQINEALFASPALKSVFQQFASEALYQQDSIPSYDAMLQFIEHEMGGISTSPDNYKVFTWLEGDARQAASRELVDVNIASINVPLDFQTINYVDYPLDHFPKPVSKKKSFSLCGLGGSSK